MAKVNWKRIVATATVVDNPFEQQGEPQIFVNVTGTSNEPVRQMVTDQVQAGVQPVFLENGLLTGIFTGSVPAGVRVCCKPGTWGEA